MSRPSIIMDNQSKPNISILKWSMMMILASLPVTRMTSADTSITWKKIMVKKGLKVNKNKTENYIISKQNHQWKKCKLLGTLLGTKEDIKRRKILAINAANNLCHFFENNKLTINLRLKLINTYIEPIFLYNSETWTLTKSIEESINTFQRRIVRRYCFNIKWPKTLRNQDLYEKMKIVEWKKKVTARRLKRFGKMVRAPEEIPGQGCIEERVIQLRPTTRETQNHLDFQSKRKLKRNEPFLAWDREPRNWDNDWVRTIKRYFDIWFILKTFVIFR